MHSPGRRGAVAAHAVDAVHEVRLSLALLGVVIAIALVQLGLAHNWPKLLRIALAAAAYGAVLLAATRTWARGNPGGAAPYWPFAAAGASAGIVSGLVRPTIEPAVVLVGALGGALLLGAVHWVGIRQWRQARASLGS